VSSIVLEARLDPILVWRVVGAPRDEDLAAFTAELDRRVDADLPFLAVIDARHADLPTTEQSRRQSAWRAARAQGLRACSLGVALVLPLEPLRRALSCMTAWRSLPGPHVLCPHMAAAMLWAEGQLLRNLVRSAA
jgi:hypothetical protein